MKILVDMGDDPHLDFWTEPGLNRPVDIMMTPFTRSNTEQKLKLKGMKVQTLIDNVETLIQAEREEAKPKIASGEMTWDDYYTHDQVPPTNYSRIQIQIKPTFFIDPSMDG